MKNIFIIGMVYCSVLTSCVLERADNYLKEEENAGKQAHFYLEHNIHIYLFDFFDIALRMNYYLLAPPEKRLEMEDRYFPECKIRQLNTNQWAGILRQDTLFQLKTDGKSLSEKNASWILGKSQLDKQKETITCLNDGKWEVQVIGLAGPYWGGWITDAIFQVEHRKEGMPDGFKNSDWTITGKGTCFDQYSQILLHFESKEPWEYIENSDTLLQEGSIEIIAEDIGKQLKETIQVRIEPLPGKGRKIQLTYKGKTYIYVNE